MIYERYIFNSCKQESSENTGAYLARLRKLAATCEYGVPLDEMLRDRIVIGIADNQIWARLLRESKLTLRKALEICRSSKQANLHLQQVDSGSETTHCVKSRGKQGMTKPKSQTTAFICNCLFCGTSHNRGRCPAYGATCAKCYKKNHRTEQCRANEDDKVGARPKYDQKTKL